MFATKNLDSQTPLAIVTGVVASVNQLQELQGGADSTLLLSGSRVNGVDGYSYPKILAKPQRSYGVHVVLNHNIQAEDDPLCDGCDSERNMAKKHDTMAIAPFVSKHGARMRIRAGALRTTPARVRIANCLYSELRGSHTCSNAWTVVQLVPRCGSGSANRCCVTRHWQGRLLQANNLCF